MANDFDTDGFNTVTLRVDPSSLTATVEGPAKFHYGDTVTFVVTGLKVADPSTLEFMAASSGGLALASIATGTDWEFVPNASSKAYAKYTFDTAGAQTVAAALALGVAAPIRLYLRDTAGRMLLDQSAEFFRTPYPVSGDDDPLPISYMISKADLATALNGLSAESLTPGQTEEKLTRLIARLLELTV